MPKGTTSREEEYIALGALAEDELKEKDDEDDKLEEEVKVIDEALLGFAALSVVCFFVYEG